MKRDFPVTSRRVVTRYAPSPTGFFHIGAVRTALFSYVFAKQSGGAMILRIEDTDAKRSKKEYEEDIVSGLAWLGISYDGPYRQSERGEVYAKYLTRLIAEGKAYESAEAEGTVIRFKNPGRKVRFTDAIRGEIETDTTELKDFVIARSLQSPLFHLVVVIDDYEMGVTHVIRGEDHIPNTPRQILIQEALGFPQPVYAHLPLVLAPDKSKLSKRNLSGEMVAVRDYRKAGFLPEAIINFSALLGWSPEEEGKDVFTLSELVPMFSFARIQKGGAQFNRDRLRWLNKEHMKRLPQEAIVHGLAEHMPERVTALPQYTDERLKKSKETLFERIEVFSDLDGLGVAGDLDYFFAAPEYSAPLKIVSAKGDGEGYLDTTRHIDNTINILSSIPDESFSKEKVKELLWDYATAEGRGAVLWPMRYALSGRDKSPDPFTLAGILGKEETLARIEAAKEALKK